MTDPILTISRATKRYGPVHALDRVDLTVEEGEFLTLLGPSGSGKTTLLSAIAGFAPLSEGRIDLRGRDITSEPPEHRDFGMVFQGYALFPTMTVRDNIAFPLKVRKRPASEIKKRVEYCLGLVQMEDFADRMPSQMSGGQQQRIALARALSFEPQVLLLDEPLSALDKKLRADLQWELKSLHDSLGVTFIYVTHDQDEALSMSDRVVILKDGRIQQQGVPDALYNHPRNRFVADFLGKSNFMDLPVRGREGDALTCAVGDTQFPVEAPGAEVRGDVLNLALRPERIRLGAPGEEMLDGTIRQVSYLGERCLVMVDHDVIGPLLISQATWKEGVTPRAGLPVSFGWDSDACVVMEAEPA
ncbi:polyamine ABC transporter ATP-binding protein [Pelagivirga sediminicola]|uniref:Polyamine ABC transporter ATP-binding protein n=1 Tax=Pelagivirga sediminicola TaxID=2170575 RepID=A0A2T7G7Z6_9RHOB|nr:ABC transporter ATP-binding protein [Pelagivirga sediminicola]PVA10539.1 polyamine ABC transporter ATP-binding protein [Pelagivirga sediminicola]